MSAYGARTIKPRPRRTRAEMEVFREALYEIVEEHAPITVRGLPTRPGKAKDPQAERFALEYGEGCVELDAIPPATLRSLVREKIEGHMDPGQLRVMKLAEEQEREVLRSVWAGGA